MAEATEGRNFYVNIGRAAWEPCNVTQHLLYDRGKPRKILIVLAGVTTFRMRTDFQPAVRRLNTWALTVVPICAVALNVARLNNIKEFVPPQRKHNVSVTTINWLMLFKEINAVYSENHM
jgi:hypothetical protein